MTDRRSFLAGAFAAAAAARLRGLALPTATVDLTGAPRAIPTPDQLAWQDLEIGMFLHFAPNTFQNKEKDDLSTPLSSIDPDIDTDNWAQCAVNLGAKYVVMVAKHAGGFCMWQTETTTYSIGHTAWEHGHGDVMRNLEASCRKYGLRMGVYLSPRDENFGAGTGGVCKDPAKQDAYNAMYREQLTEVLSRYGRMVEVWFDGSLVVPVSDILDTYAPDSVIFQGPCATIRWVGNEDGFAPYPLWDAESVAEARSGVSTAIDSDPDGGAWVPVECDVSIRRPYWFWSTTNVKNLLTFDQLLSVYYRSVGRGAQLLLNVPPNRNGHIADEDFARVKEFGAELGRRFGRSAGETAGTGNRLELNLAKAGRVDHVILEEDCRFGQRVRAFRLEARAKDGWTALYTGSSIGHKRIVPVGPITCPALRLVVTETQGGPHIRRFAAFDTGAAPPVDWDATAEFWAPDTAGSWDHYQFKVDLTKSITAATQYRVRFIPTGGRVTGISQAQLLLNGAPEPDLVRKDPSASDALILTMTEIGQSTVLSGSVEGAERGTILLEKL